MAFTMHSHSGQFCPGHAKDDLEVIIKHAISIGYKTMGLTEHMPRYSEEDLYPEELDDPAESLRVLPQRHEDYITHALAMQKKYQDQIHILIGFEADFIRPSYGPKVLSLAASPHIDYFIGSLHHVNTIPIDYDAAFYAKALQSSGGTEEALYEQFFDEHYEMLTALKPKVVGHFDLIRLLSSDEGANIGPQGWKGVWEKIQRNLKAVKENGGWLECNSSGLRKGLKEPYPCRAIAEEWLKIGGKFTMSDDSHGIAQVATNYRRAVDYLGSLGVEEVWTFRRSPHPDVEGGKKSELEEVAVKLGEFREKFPQV